MNFLRAIHPNPPPSTTHKYLLLHSVNMVKSPKMTSTHLSILLFAQNTWNHHENDSIKMLIHKMLNARQASFLIGTTDQKNEKCIVCSQIYDLLNKIKGINDGRLFISHNILDTFYIWDPDHRNEVIDFTDQILALNSIKKLYILQVGSFKANLAYLKTFCLDDHLTYRKLLRTEFLGILNENGFENNILYEIVKDSY